MANKGLEGLRGKLLDQLGLHDTIEVEQIFDILLAKHKDKEEDGKSSTLMNIVRTLQSEGTLGEELKSAVKLMVDGYQGDDFPRFALSETNPGEPSDSILNEVRRQQSKSTLKDACDEYICAVRYHQMEKPKPGSVCSGEDRELILTAVYAALYCGASYLTVSYPPPAFMDKVLSMEGMTREEFHATVRDAMEEDVSFELLCKEAAEKHPEDFQDMCKSYKEMLKGAVAVGNVEEPGEYEEHDTADDDRSSGDDYTDDDTPVVDRPKGGGVGGFFKKMFKGLTGAIASVFGDRQKCKERLNGAADRFVNSSKKITGKVGKKMLIVWRIITGVNIAALLIRVIVVFISFFVDCTGQKTDAVQGFFQKIPLIGGLMSKGTQVVSAHMVRTNLLMKSIPEVIALTVVTIFAMQTLRRKEEGERDNVFQMLMSLLVIVATTAAVIVFFRLGKALFAAWPNMHDGFWGTFYANF